MTGFITVTVYFLLCDPTSWTCEDIIHDQDSVLTCCSGPRPRSRALDARTLDFMINQLSFTLGKGVAHEVVLKHGQLGYAYSAEFHPRDHVANETGVAAWR